MPKSKKIRPPFKTNGGKYYLSTWIINHFPDNYQELNYIEPYAGAASVLLNKERSVQEAINDLEKETIEIFRCLRDEPGRFIGRLKRTKYCENTYNKAFKNAEDKSKEYMDKAIAEFVLRRMSYGGNKKTFSPNNSSWETIVYNELEIISERLQNVYLFCKPAIQVIKAWNDPGTLCYCDPPDITEENEAEQIQLTDVLLQFKGLVAISGKPCTLYRNKFKEWRCFKKKQAGSRKKECLWINY